ncbi:MAG: ABC transporter permease, partial [Gemmatimonadaceae bacterium]
MLALIWRRLRLDRRAMTGVIVVVLLVFAAAAAPLIARHDPIEIELANQPTAPSGEHWLGTDNLGRDIWARIVFGARISLAAGIISQT